ncbi:MAG: carbohydrate-binding protein [Opitutaceae bacterium]
MKTSYKALWQARLLTGLLTISILAPTGVAIAQTSADDQAASAAQFQAKMERSKEKLVKARQQKKAAFSKGRHNLKDKAVRAELVRRLKEADQAHMEAVRERAELKGLEIKGTRNDGRGFRLIDFDENDQPVYEIDENVNAAISTATDVVRDNSVYRPTSTQIEAESYSSMDGVQVETTTDTGGGQNIGYIENGDWAEYTINIPAAGQYRLSLRTASNNNDGGTIALTANGSSIGSIDIPDTNGWQTWTTVTAHVVFNTSGSQTLRMDFSGGAGSLFNLNWFSYNRSITIGLWEATGIPRLTHQELEGKITVMDGSTSTGSHATHVAGTLVAEGINPDLKGMNPSASIAAFMTSQADAEMIANGADAPNTTKLYISNHSYGVGQGWESSSSNDYDWLFWGTFVNDDDPSNDYDEDFGRYSSSAVTWDSITYNLPYYLPFISSGNHRSDNPSNGDTVRIYGVDYTYDDTKHPLGDRYYKNGWDNMEGRKLAKNAISVGRAKDAVTGGVRDPDKYTDLMNTGSSRGPTDDGRIKPDVVANGDSLLSTDSGNDTDTGTKSGTSMACPNACGSAALLIDYYTLRFPSQSMRASTLKALILHTAYDRGDAGPDYKYGWGLMDTQAAADVIQLHADGNGSAHMLEDLVNDTTTTSQSHVFKSDGSSPLRVTICWTDPPGTEKTGHENRTKVLVNDLNLTVTGPGGTHYPYVMPHVGDWSVGSITDNATTGVNDVDNVEQVYLATPAAGDYTVTVNYVGGLTNNEQVYSLIVTGATIYTELETWRLEHFGTSEGTGDYADGADFDKDGNTNLIEFALATDPNIANVAPITFTDNVSTIDLFYDRNVDAMVDYDFQVKWNDDLTNAGGWFDTDVTELILSDDGSVQEVKATAPKDAATQRFYQLSITPK